MKFSIIVVAYKRYNQLPCLLYSLLSQTYKNFEVIIIHDGKDEEYMGIANTFSQYENFKFLETENRYNDWGMSLRNIGIPLVTGDFVINTNDDNYYTPNWLQELNTAIQKNPDANFICYDMILSHNNKANHNKKDYGVLVPQLKRCYIDMGQFAVKRDIIQKYRFNITDTADGELVEAMLPELTPYYIDKVLFVHN